MLRLLRKILLSVLYFTYLSYGKQGFGPGEQDWGYVEVRPGAHMFWWLYYTTNTDVSNPNEKPLLIWLQGGPGVSSTGIGNFREFGPLDPNLRPRKHSWVKDYNILFIDNPVGSGFSYVEKKSDLARSNYQIAQDLMQLMYEFYNKLPMFRTTPTYVLGQSYGGKMGTEWALLWYKHQQLGYIQSNLRGVGLGNSWISPVDSVLAWAPFLWQMGKVDQTGYMAIDSVAEQIETFGKLGLWSHTKKLYRNLASVVEEVTNNISFYNILEEDTDPGHKEPVVTHLMNGLVRQTLRPRSNWSALNTDVFDSLSDEYMTPVDNLVEQLLDQTDLKVIVYNGQLDLIVCTPGTWSWINKLRWDYAQHWQASMPSPLVVNDVIEGYHKSFDDLSFYWVEKAGHLVPSENPAAMTAILQHLTNQNV
ncbi:hypothetical protein QAD02_009326 [Eretmocerus hayati]|uniref:Uncharacterized protein n=1 Tax=Eretmocerus hayati TaxID=131215 RepID=A0ACC2N9R7_9HYME|nr:hypothetical protein QAD02_009326 [Eretmocerus hayati]